MSIIVYVLSQIYPFLAISFQDISGGSVFSRIIFARSRTRLSTVDVDSVTKTTCNVKKKICSGVVSLEKMMCDGPLTRQPLDHCKMYSDPDCCQPKPSSAAHTSGYTRMST
jgi:hypothetical protein